jgi:Transposase DDE domain
VVAIEPTERRNDRGLAPAMLAQVERRCGKPPSRLLADLGAMTAADIVGFAGTHPAMEVFSPMPGPKTTSKPESKARYQRNRAAEPQRLKDWRARMDSEDGQAVYKRRSNTEHVHARMKNRGFGRWSCAVCARSTSSVCSTPSPTISYGQSAAPKPSPPEPEQPTCRPIRYIIRTTNRLSRRCKNRKTDRPYPANQSDTPGFVRSF